MSYTRRYLLSELNPKFMEDIDGTLRYLHFDCPEPHEGCSHTIPFNPPIHGQLTHPILSGQAQWDRKGEDFATMTFTPSIRRVPRYKTREEVIKDGGSPDHIEDTLFCHMHITITNGKVEFHKDSG